MKVRALYAGGDAGPRVSGSPQTHLGTMPMSHMRETHGANPRYETQSTYAWPSPTQSGTYMMDWVPYLQSAQ